MPQQSTIPKRKLSRRILVFRVIIVLLLVVISAEIAMRLGYAVFRSGLNLQTLIDQQYNLIHDEQTGRQSGRPNALHPYVGLVIDPTHNSKCNSYGFWQIDGPILKRSSSTVIVGITGGSVAKDLCTFSAETLRDELSRKLPGKEIKIVCLAQEGFREPQLAMTLAYFQTLGAEFDVVVSLSGFNEAALHPAESSGDSLWIGYPRDWDMRLRDTEDPEVNRLVLEGQMAQITRTAWAARAYSYRHIPLFIVHGTWAAIDSVYRHRADNVSTQLMAIRHRIVNRYANVGPSVQYSTAEARRDAQCEMWCAGARQLQRLSRSADATFLLCLQPNLYVETSKPLTDEEQEIKRRGSIYQEWVEKNYAHFAAAGVALRAEGIAFFDLCRLYDDVSSTVYRDECCHFNLDGNNLLATRLAELITDELKDQKPGQ